MRFYCDNDNTLVQKILNMSLDGGHSSIMYVDVITKSDHFLTVIVVAAYGLIRRLNALVYYIDTVYFIDAGMQN